MANVTILLNEHAMKQYNSLENLRKFNNGNFKSDKQAKYIATWADEYYVSTMKNCWGFTDDQLPQEGEYVIKFITEVHYGDWTLHGRGRGVRPFSRIYIMDKHGIKRVHKLKFKIHYQDGIQTGWEPIGNEVIWERTVVTFHPAEEPEAKPEVKETENKVEAQPEQVSEWVGAVGEKMEFKAQVIKVKDIETEYGWKTVYKTLYIFKDEQGNILKTFYSGHKYDLEEKQWYTFKAKVKKHDTWNGEKFTLLSHLSAVKEVTA